MCLKTNHPELKVADRDIVVYKRVVTYHVRNPNQKWFEKLFGLRKYITKHTALVNNYEYRVGASNPKVELRAWPIGVEPSTYEVEKGYHSDTSLRDEHNAIFVIPKGTNYIEGWYNDEPERENLVSETIVLKELIPSKR
jgi:hypothetical protein